MLEGLQTVSVLGAMLMAAFSSSPTYQLQTYGVGSGGSSTSSSPTYRLNGSSGELSGTRTTSPTGTSTGSGSTETRQANTPLTPTLSNGSGTFYNKLQLTINTSGSDATDYTYSIAVSTDNFVTTTYLQSDGTLGGTAIYRTYSAWGGASGTTLVGLSPGITYQAKVNANQVNYTQSAYGPTGSAATVKPALSFSITPSTVSLGTLLPGTVRAGNSSASFTFATNAGAGGSVYVAGSNAGLRSAANNFTISAANANLASANQGFGMQGLTTSQASGGPLSIDSPFNGANDNVGAPTTVFQQLFSSPVAVTSGTATAAIKGKANASTPSGTDYSETLTFIASASY